MRHESFGLETYSPYQDKDLTDYRIFDSGDLELCFGSAELALLDIESRAEEILAAGKLPVLLGGEHLVTLGSFRAIQRHWPDVHIIHFDAHADLRDDYLGAKLSHACVIRRCHDLLGDGRIHQFGIRSGEREEFRFAREHTDLHPFTFDGLEELVQTLEASRARSISPSTWTAWTPPPSPEPAPRGGRRHLPQLLEAIQMVAKTNVVGADVNELAPMLDQSGVSTAAACKVLRELLLALSQ